VYLYEFHVFLIGFILLNAYLIDRVRVMPITEKKYNPNFSFFLKEKIYIIKYGGSRDRMVVGFITTYAISAHHH
jgi:hypothetical protein